jgi:hypothetical protein
VADDCACACVASHGRATGSDHAKPNRGGDCRQGGRSPCTGRRHYRHPQDPASRGECYTLRSLSLSRSCLALRRTTRTGGWARSSTPKTTPSSLATKVGLSSPLSSQTLVRARMAVLNRCATSCRPTRSAAIQCGEDPHHPPTHDRRARASVVLIFVVSDDNGKQLGDHHQPAIATGSQADTTFLPRALSLRLSVLRLCR